MAILIVSDNKNIFDELSEKLRLMRSVDIVVYSNLKNLKSVLRTNNFDIIVVDTYEPKIISIINSVNNSAKVILLSEKWQCFDDIYDCVNPDITSEELSHKLLNCLKYIDCQKKFARNNLYLELTGIINSKNGLYSTKYLKEIFNEYPKIKESIFCILTLDKSAKTKVSINRLAGIIKKSLRSVDIALEAGNGLFYIVFEDCDLSGAKTVLLKIQDKMGDDFRIRAGISKIGFQDFDELEKNAKDSLLLAIKNEEICASLTDNINASDWVETEQSQPKEFKLFRKIFDNKLKNIIEPQFYKFQKDFGKKLDIIQYTNNAESALSIKSIGLQSEITLRFDSQAGVKIEISHSGLESAENSSFVIPLNKFNEKELLKLLKQLKQEHLASLEA